jgi:hypothetical protein
VRFHTARVIFVNDDAHPPSVVCLRKQKDQRVRFTASRTSLRMLLAASESHADVGAKARRRALAPLHPVRYGTSTPFGSQRPRQSRPPGKRSLTAPPGPAGSKGCIGMQASPLGVVRRQMISFVKLVTPKAASIDFLSSGWQWGHIAGTATRWASTRGATLSTLQPSSPSRPSCRYRRGPPAWPAT